MFISKLISCVFVAFVFILASGYTTKGQDFKQRNYIDTINSKNAFRIVAKEKAAQIFIDPNDEKGVARAAKDLADDIGKVSGIKAQVFEDVKTPKGSILIGTIGSSRIIDKLIADKKIDVSEIKGQWESYLIQTVDGNLVIVGSDRRGTIYGIYDVSENIGVSPWYWWADVPVKKNKALYVKAGRYLQKSPKVKYRGIFINDEEPSFGGWARNKFGGINSKMYAHMFELILRLKGNYLWPAMWGKSFNEDDPLNPVVANEYGIIMGTSHHEPMMRSHTEYTSRKNEVGAWNYSTNKTNLDKFFTDGLERNKKYDNLITIGMRGDGDVALSDEGDEKNIETLRQVVKGQREIIQKVYNKNPSEVPQMWAIFTEVQRYYDAGLNVPDDVLLLFCDNNWGYIRRTGPEKEKNRIGGMGLYYHIDMNGGPWNDRWINTTTVPKLYEQFNLAYRTGLNDLWVVNVGDLKPKELPIDFILRYAWNPDFYNPDNLKNYTIDWATRIFGAEHAEEIADIVSKYSKYNLWRKPEVQSTTIFSIVNHHETDSVLSAWHALTQQVETLRPKIPTEAQDAFYQLVYYPAKASAGVAEIYIAAARNNLYAQQGRVSANDYAKRANDLFEIDKQLSNYYNDVMANGKWKNMMSDVHIGYVQWNMPSENKLPPMSQVQPLPNPSMGVAIEGSEQAWPGAETQAVLPTFDAIRKQSYYIDIFNKGIESFQFEVKTDKPWIILSSTNGKVDRETRLQVQIDWKSIPMGKSEGIIEIRQGSNVVNVKVEALNASVPNAKRPFFGGLTGEFSIPTNKFNANIEGSEAKWIAIPDLGRADACMGVYPVTSASVMGKDAPYLEYDILVNQDDSITICIGILPTQDINPERGLRLAVALNDNEPMVIDARKGFHDEFREYTPDNLSRAKSLKPLPKVDRKIALIGRGEHRRSEVFDNQRWLDIKLDVKKSGIQTLKIYMVDPEIVIEKIVVNPDNNHPSYFGAPTILNNN
ncbi:MAG: glycosyl hydrolase 115 family protein [Prolixibacteraceae bacterium]|nr:glycosyl hydrolase 115 family protein [Prolixibacteraceae bacterium]